MGKPAALWFNQLLLLTGHGAGTRNDCPLALTWDAGEIVDSYHPIVDTRRVGVRPPFLLMYFCEELHQLDETLKDSQELNNQLDAKGSYLRKHLLYFQFYVYVYV